MSFNLPNSILDVSDENGNSVITVPAGGVGTLISNGLNLGRDDRPENPDPGTMYFNNKTQQLLIYVNNRWRAVVLEEPKKRTAQTLEQAIDDVKSEIYNKS